MNRPAVVRTAQDFVERLSMRTPHFRQKAMLLSGGNLQKVVLAKWLASQPKVLILDERTRGIDVGAKAEVHALMSGPARSGIGILMISSELPEIMAMSDRIVVIHEGRIAAILSRGRRLHRSWSWPMRAASRGEREMAEEMGRVAGRSAAKG